MNNYILKELNDVFDLIFPIQVSGENTLRLARALDKIHSMRTAIAQSMEPQAAPAPLTEEEA